jgi:predicted nucleotidyltransferase
MEYKKVLKVERIRKKLHEEEITFLNKMQNYLTTPIYLYGSLFRFDYFPYKSDLDVYLFSNNSQKLVKKLVHYLNIHLSSVKYVYINNKITGRNIKGFKINYSHSFDKIGKSTFFHRAKTNKCFEVFIYDKKDKEYMIEEHHKQIRTNTVFLFIMYIAKMLNNYFYFSKKILSEIKSYLFNIDQMKDADIKYLGQL